MFQDLSAAQEFVRRKARLVEGIQQGTFTFARIELQCVCDGKLVGYQGCGFSKYRPSDAKQGLPYSPERGREIAIGRAVALIARALMDDQRKHVIGSLADRILEEMLIVALAG